MLQRQDWLAGIAALYDATMAAFAVSYEWPFLIDSTAVAQTDSYERRLPPTLPHLHPGKVLQRREEYCILGKMLLKNVA